MTELVYREISCQKAVNGNNFSQGNQDFNFSIGNPTAWLPDKSYFRITTSLRAIGRTNANPSLATAPAQPTVQDQMAFADSALACLYNNVYFRAGGQDVSSIVNYVPQAHALKMRVMKSGAWLNSVGKSAYMLESDFQKRVSVVSSDESPDADEQNSYLSVSLVPSVPASVTGTAGAAGLTTVTAVGSAFLTCGLAVGDSVEFGGVRSQVQAITDATHIVVRGGPAIVGANAGDIPIYGLKMTRRDGGQRNVVNGLWQPPIGIFQHSEPMGAGDYRFSLNPNTNYQRAAVQSSRLNGASTGGAAPSLLTDNGGLVPSTDPSSDNVTSGDFALNIIDVKLYVATIKVSIPKDISFLELIEMEIVTKPVQGINSTYEFVVPSSTMALAFFSQSGASGSNTFCPPTRFRQDVIPVGAVGASFNCQNLVRSLQITYANSTKPSTRWASAYDNAITGTVTGTVNELQQRYNDDLQECGLINNHGGAETFGEWIQRGPYFYYSFSRDREDRSTQVQVAVEFAVQPEANANIMLAAFYSRVTEISVAGGQVQQVRGLNR